MMSTTSHPWKQTLERQANTLRKLNGTRRMTATAGVRLEETVVLGCHAIRRLINSFLLPEARCHQLFPMTAFPRRRQDVPLLGDEPLQVRYDLAAGRVVQHDPMFLCHQILQNCVFEPWLDADHRLTGIYVTSDHQRKIALYGISLSTLTDLFLRLGAGSPANS